MGTVQRGEWGACLQLIGGDRVTTTKFEHAHEIHLSWLGATF